MTSAHSRRCTARGWQGWKRATLANPVCVFKAVKTVKAAEDRVKAAEDRVKEAIFVDTRESDLIAAKARVIEIDTLETRLEKEAEENIMLETAKNVMIELERLLTARLDYHKELKNLTFTPENYDESISKIRETRMDLD